MIALEPNTFIDLLRRFAEGVGLARQARVLKAADN